MTQRKTHKRSVSDFIFIVRPQMDSALQLYGTHRILNDLGPRLHAFWDKVLHAKSRCLRDGTFGANDRVPNSLGDYSFLTEAEWNEYMKEFESLMLDVDFLNHKISLEEFNRRRG